jgi:hypothetical protein
MVSITDERDLRRGARLIVAAFAVRPLMSQLVKIRRTQPEQMSSGVLLRNDIARRGRHVVSTLVSHDDSFMLA